MPLSIRTTWLNHITINWKRFTSDNDICQELADSIDRFENLYINDLRRWCIVYIAINWKLLIMLPKHHVIRWKKLLIFFKHFLNAKDKYIIIFLNEQYPNISHWFIIPFLFFPSLLTILIIHIVVIFVPTGLLLDRVI